MDNIKVILVDKNDNAIGVTGKMEAHEKALLHRAVSVFIFNSSGKMLLQKRALHKYHSPGLWTNTTCTHPEPGETNLQAAKRRLQQEMGLQSDLDKAFDFIYKAALDNNLTEHELDHVFVGITDMPPNINNEEVSEYKYIDPQELVKDLSDNPQKYTFWFRMIAHRVLCLQNVITGC